MAAGLGFKDFVTGEVLTAADVDGYLMQGIWVFANATARDAAVTSPQEGNACYLKDTNEVLTYSGSAWVAVGATGPTSYGLTSGKNAFINSNFGVWQRGTSISIAGGTSNTYTSDRFALTVQANQASTVSRQATNDTTNLPTIQYCARVQRNFGQTGTGSMIFGQSLETSNSLRFAGQTVTLSFYARAGSNYSPTSSVLTANIYTGTGTDQNRVSASYTGDVQALTTNATLTTTWQRFSVSGSIAATATELAVIFVSSMTGTAGTNDYYEVTGVQIENGSTVTTFQTATGTIQGELAACQRYLPSVPAVGGDTAMGQCFSTTQALIVIPFQVTPRVAPTGVTVTAGNFQVRNISAVTIAVTALTFVNANQTSACLQATVASGLIAGSATMLNNTAPGLILFTGSEL